MTEHPEWFDEMLAEAELTSSPERIVGRTRLIWKQRRSVIVSTVVLPWADGKTLPPYETQVIGPDISHLPHPMNFVESVSFGGRYWTHDLAEEGHRAWCRLIAGWLTFAGRHTVTWKELTNWQ